MGSFHGRRKPSAKKSSKPKGDTAEDIAARQARDQFIKDMAAKAASSMPASDSEAGGIHPSRLARADPFSGGQPNHQYAQHRQPDRPARGQRAPDLRKQANKRTFEDTNHTESGDGHAAKKQRTLEEIRKLKGPAAMKKEEEKRRRQAEASRNDTKADATTTVDSEDDDSPIVSKKGKKNITVDSKSTKTPEEKAQRKLEKAARKAAKKAAGNADSEMSSAPEAHVTQKETGEVITEDKQTKEQRKERKRLAKLAATQSDAVDEKVIEDDSRPEDSPDAVMTEKKEKKEKKKEKKDKGEKKEKKEKKDKKPKHLQEEVHDKVAAPARPSDPSSNWNAAASSLGAKSSKFMKLLGGAKNGMSLSTTQSSGHTDKIRDAQKAEKELQKQFASGMQAKHSGVKRGGLGA